MISIDLDFDVWQVLQAARRSETDSASDVIRRALELPPRPKQQRSWVTRHGGTFHHGTPFRAIYKGKEYRAEVVDGALEFQGGRYKSPSAAARHITGGAVNGWNFWEFQFKGDSETWHRMRNARKTDQ